MNETELERIVVRLVGEGSEYQKMLTDAVKNTEAAAGQVKQAAAQIEGFKNSLVGFGQQMIGALGMFGVASSLKSAFDASQQLEQGQIRLRNTIQATGQDVTAATARFTALAESISKDTLLTKGQIFAMTQRATAMGLNAETAERVVRNSVALAGATGQEAEGLLRAAAAIERGNYQLARRQLGLQGVKDETELVRIVNNMMVGGMKTQQELAETASGKLEKLGRSLRSLNVELGGIVASAIQPVVNYVAQAVASFNSLDAATKKLTAGIVGIMLGVRPLIGLIRTVTTVFLGWQGVLVGLAAAAALIWVRMTYGADNALKVVTEFWEGIKAAAAEWMDYFAYAVQNFGTEWDRLSTRMGVYLARGFRWVLQAWGATTGAMKIAWTEVTAWIEGAWVNAWNRLRNSSQQLGTALFTSGFGQGIMRMFGYSEDAIRTTVGQMTREQRDANAAVNEQIQGSLREIEARRQEMRNAIAREITEAGGAMTPIINEMQRNLDRLDAQFNDRFLQFRQSRVQTAQRQALDVGQGIGSSVVQGIKEGMDNIDAVLAFSAEALTRLANYRDTVLGGGRNARPGAAAVRPAAPLGSPAQVAALIGVGGGGGNNAVLGVLGQIAASTRQTAERPPVQINAANLEE